MFYRTLKKLLLKADEIISVFQELLGELPLNVGLETKDITDKSEPEIRPLKSVEIILDRIDGRKFLLRLAFVKDGRIDAFLGVENQRSQSPQLLLTANLFLDKENYLEMAKIAKAIAEASLV